MLPGLTTAASGMQVNERMQQLLANNLANEETPGFKASLSEAMETPVKSVYEIQYGGPYGRYIGQTGSGVDFQEGVLDFSTGTLSQTNRPLDVAIVDKTPAGAYAAVQSGSGSTSQMGAVTVGAGGVLGVNGQPLCAFDADGQPVQGVIAIRNPAYQGTQLTGVDGGPDYDGAGHPSYLFANQNGQVIGLPGEANTQGLALRVGNQTDMGYHSFYAVNYTSPSGQTGIALTKDGALQLDKNNNLVDPAGHPILPVGLGGQVIPYARIHVNPNYTGTSLFGPNGGALTDKTGQVSYQVIGANGAVIANAHLGTVDADVTALSPLGQTEFIVGNSLSPATVLPQLRTGTGKLKPGQLEGSNVDATSVMTQMLDAANLYEANQRVVQTEDQLLDKAVNDIGRVQG